MIRSRVVVAIALVAVLVAIGGCTTVGTDDPDGEVLLADALSADENITDVTGERTVTVSDTAGEHTTTERFWEAPPDHARVEAAPSSADEGAFTETVFVRSGPDIWLYEADDREATAFDREDVTDESESVDEFLERVDVAYEGTDSVADRETHVVNVTVRNDSVERGIGVLVGDTQYVYPLETVEHEDTELRSQQLWIDDEFGYVLKHRQTFEDVDGGELEITVVHEEVAFNEGVDDERFTLDDDVSVVEEPSVDEREFEDRESAQEYAPFDLPTVDLPAAYERERLSADEYGEELTVHEQYSDGETMLWFSVSEHGLLPDDPDREGVGDVEASVVELDAVTLVTWECGGLEHELSADLEAETLLEFAATVSCD
ncbi:LolA family protein [Natrononativus amylolyticus]|uniref:LolA family protein n=1 Tax=Natrononativus amylolyticus TaxID=2963434 RepID=UPI0020CF08C6|nr:hypothetical protein [Natrononativus amylolyticus]